MKDTQRIYGNLTELLKKYKFFFTPSFDGRLTRFDRNGKTLSAWCVGKQTSSSGQPLQMLMFGDFATGETYEWWSRKSVSKEDAKQIEETAKAERKKFERAKLLKQTEAAKEVSDFWETLPADSSPTPYSFRKKLFELYGARCDEGKNLYVPLYSADGKMQNMQRIEAAGQKRFWPGGAINGNFFFIGHTFPESPATLYLCEGYATGASIYEAKRQGRSSPLHQDEDAGGAGQPEGAENPPRAGDCGQPDNDGTCRVAQAPTDTSAEDGRSVDTLGVGERGTSQAHGAPKTRIERRREEREALRNSLLPELLAAVETTDDQDGPSLRPRQGSGPSLPPLASPEGDAVAECDTGPSGGASCRSGGGEDSGIGGVCAPERHDRGTSGNGSGCPSEEEFAVACAFAAGNLANVARALTKRWPGARLVVCADNDQWTRRVDGTPWNPGLEAAADACSKSGGHMCTPYFMPDELANKPTDFNDLASLQDGSSRVLQAIEHPDTKALLPQNNFSKNATNGTATPSALVTYDRAGNAKIPPPQLVVSALMDQYDGLLTRQGVDLFKYGPTHWHHLDQDGLYELSMVIQRMCDNQCSPYQLDTFIEMLRRTIPKAPTTRNLFSADPWSANFLNGTLHVVRNCTRYNLEFRPHSKSDFITNTLPYEYRPAADLPTNEEFEDMMLRMFEGDSDASEKRRAVAQLFGLCVVPMTSRLFMLFGKPLSGKSTIIKLAAHLVAADNACSVDPTDFNGFNMETMAGKLVNYVTDICTSKPIIDATIKRIEDRIPQRISRKFQKDINAPLPSVHIFGGNDIPPTLDGVSRAHARRWTFIKFNNIMGKGQYDKDYAETIFSQNPLGILKFALMGLEDLCANNRHFIQPKSGVQKLEEWSLENDPVGVFLDAIEAGEVLDNNTIVKKSTDGAISRSRLFALFSQTCPLAFPDRRVMSQQKFYGQLESRGFRLKKVKGIRIIEGIGIEPRTGGQF